MLRRIPRLTMPLSMLLADLGNPSPQELARALDVSERTVFRWVKADRAPKAVMLALFWLTSWGHSQVQTDAHNDAVIHASVVRALRREVEDLTGTVERLGRIADFGSANDPAPGVARQGPTPPPMTSKVIKQRPPATSTAAEVIDENCCTSSHSATSAPDSQGANLLPGDVQQRDKSGP